MRRRGLSAVVVAVAWLGFAGGVAGAESIAGKWAGTVTENRGTSDPYVYTVYLEVQPSGKAGTVQYLRYPCGAKLTFASVGGDASLFDERLYYGKTICMDNLQARISRVSPDEVSFEEFVNGAPNVTGRLRRVH
jgi:hypothetical protein